MHEHDAESFAAGSGLLSRRQFAQAALASAGLFIALPGRAQPGQPPLGTTAESPMGPFYPLHPRPRTTPT